METHKRKNTINRRIFFRSAGLVASALAFLPHRLPAHPTVSTSLEGSLFKCDPYILAASDQDITIGWVTRKPCHGYVDYGLNPAELAQRAREVKDGMVHIGTIHQVTIRGLQAGQTYHYQVGAEGVEQTERKNTVFGEQEKAQTASVMTVDPSAETVEFVVFNDLHERPESFGILMPLAKIEKPAFIALNGDLVSSMRSEDHWLESVIHPLTALGARSIPIVYSRGNHETWGNHARHLPEYIGGHRQKFYYGMACGPAYVVVLDSGEARSDGDPANAGLTDFDQYRLEQGEWLKNEVKKPAFRNAKYRIVLTHIPPFYAAREIHAASHYFSVWGSTLNAANIDLMLCGHTHKPGIHPAVAGKHNFPIVIGGGPKDNGRTIMAVKANLRSLSLKLIHESGRLIGSLNL